MQEDYKASRAPPRLRALTDIISGSAIAPSMPRPLSHIRVLDLSRVLAGPWASQNLADLGAEVLKIERPGSGDDTRSWGPPFLKDKDGAETRESAYFLSVNRGKKSVTLDIAKPEGQRIARELAATCDVVLENYKVGGLAKYGLAYEDLRRINPRIVYCSITGFGQSGPSAHLPGYDFIFQGMGGLMSITGERDGEPGGGPQKVGIAVTDVLAGMYASLAVTAAIAHRERTGVGQYIDLALFDAIVAFGANQILNYFTSGKIPGRYGNAHANVVPYEVFATADGHLILAVGNDSQFASFCKVADRPELAGRPAGARRRHALSHHARSNPKPRRVDPAHPGNHGAARQQGLDRTPRGGQRTLRTDQHLQGSVRGSPSATPRIENRDSAPGGRALPHRRQPHAIF